MRCFGGFHLVWTRWRFSHRCGNETNVTRQSFIFVTVCFLTCVRAVCLHLLWVWDTFTFNANSLNCLHRSKTNYRVFSRNAWKHLDLMNEYRVLHQVRRRWAGDFNPCWGSTYHRGHVMSEINPAAALKPVWISPPSSQSVCILSFAELLNLFLYTLCQHLQHFIFLMSTPHLHRSTPPASPPSQCLN